MVRDLADADDDGNRGRSAHDGGAAVEHHDGARHVAGVVRSQVGERRRDLLGLGGPDRGPPPELAQVDVLTREEVDEPGAEVGRDHPGRDPVDPDPAGAVLGGERLREHQHATLRCGVGRVPRVADDPRHRRRVHDHTRPGFEQVRQGVTTHQEGAAQVHRDDPVEHCGVEGLGSVELPDARHVAHDAQPPELDERKVHGPGDRFGIGHVALVAPGPAAFGDDLGRGVVVTLHVEARDRGALGGEAVGGRACRSRNRPR